MPDVFYRVLNKDDDDDDDEVLRFISAPRCCGKHHFLLITWPRPDETFCLEKKLFLNFLECLPSQFIFCLTNEAIYQFCFILLPCEWGSKQVEFKIFSLPWASPLRLGCSNLLITFAFKLVELKTD